MTYKMLVVDDEYLVRRGIKETIEWFRYGIEIVGEATHGKAGLEMAQSLHPDIIITDIKMPVMDGLKLVSSIQELNLDCVILVLSGYKDFEYTKNTLEKGAFSYLLKPIDNQELVDKVLEALKHLEQKRHVQRLVANVEEDAPIIEKRIIDQLITGRHGDFLSINSKLQIYNIQIPSSGFVVYGMLDHPEVILVKDTIRTYCDALHHALINALDQAHFAHSETFIDDAAFVVLVACASAESLYQTLTQAVSTYELNHNQVISLGIGSPYRDFGEIRESYTTATKATAQKLFLAINSIDIYSIKKAQYKPMIMAAMTYIADHYHEDVSVRHVADSLFVSESYLLHLFKENVGKTFIECLTDYRILMAKRLLMEGKYKIYEVADKVGYPDVKYFSQIFRKKTGLTPSDFYTK